MLSEKLISAILVTAIQDAASNLGEAYHSMAKLSELMITAKPLTLLSEPIETSSGLEQPLPTNQATVDCTIQEFYSLLSRSLNTLEPQKMPQWARQLHDKLFGCDTPTEITFRLSP